MDDEPKVSDDIWPPLDVAAWEYSVAHADGTRQWIPCGDAAVARLKADDTYVVRRRSRTLETKPRAKTSAQ